MNYKAVKHYTCFRPSSAEFQIKTLFFCVCTSCKGNLSPRLVSGEKNYFFLDVKTTVKCAENILFSCQVFPFSCLSCERVNGSLCLLRGNLVQSVLRGYLDQIPEFSNNSPYQGPSQYLGDLSREGGGWEGD